MMIPVIVMMTIMVPIVVMLRADLHDNLPISGCRCSSQRKTRDHAQT